MKHALIVDDQYENAYLLETLLRSHGYTVEVARHGAEALVKARLQRPSVVVSDLLMPVMDGYTLLRHWKSDAGLRDIPFVVYTATYTDPDDERLARNLGADQFMLKPAEPDAILAGIDHALEGPSSAPPPPASDKANLELYSATLIRKLEEKTLELAESNRALREDVERREVAEARLRQREAELRVASKSARLGGFRVDLAGEALAWSAELSELHGIAAEAVPTLSALLGLVDRQDRDELRAAFTRCAGEGQAFDLEARFCAAGGRPIWVRVIGQPAREEHGAITGIQGVLQDVDGRRRLEERLRHAQKLEAVGQLAGGIAHDFNNLLAVMLGFSGLALADGTLDEPRALQIREVYKAAERGAELTRQLLAFSHRQVLTPRQLDLGGVLRGMESLLRRLLPADIELRFAIDGRLGSVLADPTQIEQVVLNLAVNARDAMPRGGRLTLGAAPCDVHEPGSHEAVPTGSYVVLSVADTGVGIDDETRQHIFEPFFTTKEKGKGTGLGLATVFGIVTQSGGYLRVESAPGRGATFQLYFPRSERAVEPLPTPSVPEPHTLRGTETVLLVEDEPQVRAMMTAVLAQQGYDVLAAQNAGDALLICEQHGGPIQLLVSDMVMPRLGGRELARRLTAIRPSMRVLFVTGYAQPELLADALGGAEVLAKPFTPSVLSRRVRELLDR